MTNRQDDEELDELVSATYREFDALRTPERLNKAVMRMAASNRRRDKSLFSAWLRPITWAATIGISLAIVMQLSQLPTAPAVPAIDSNDNVSQNPPATVQLQDLALGDTAMAKKDVQGNRHSFAAAAPMAVNSAAPASDPATACNSEARQSPDDWLKCIDNLRASDALEQAEREYEALILQFPAAAVTSETNK